MGSGGFFSGERESARVAEGVLLCEEVWEMLLALPDESFVRMLALRERWRVVPRSPRVEEMLCREEACLRRGGVERDEPEGSLLAGSYWLG